MELPGLTQSLAAKVQDSSRVTRLEFCKGRELPKINLRQKVRYTNEHDIMEYLSVPQQNLTPPQHARTKPAKLVGCNLFVPTETELFQDVADD